MNDDRRDACKLPDGTFEIHARMTNCGWHGTDERIDGTGRWCAENNGMDRDDGLVMIHCSGPGFEKANIRRTRDEVERMYRGDEELVTKLVEEANELSSGSKLEDIFVTNVSKGSKF